VLDALQKKSHLNPSLRRTKTNIDELPEILRTPRRPGKTTLSSLFPLEDRQ
jgi:hypothetical protein